MAPNALPASPGRWDARRISIWFTSIASIAIVVIFFGWIGSQVVGNTTPLPFSLVKDVSLPSAVPARFLPGVKDAPANDDPLAPGVTVNFDHFDFQAIDPRTGLLFIAHSGPNPDKMHGLVNPKFQADKDVDVDGHVLVIDTKTNALVNRVNVPQVAGVVVAPDIGRVYVADAAENRVVAIDEKTFRTTTIQLADLESPDAIEYDQTDHKIFVSDPGTPADNATNTSPDNQNLSVIDVRTNRVTRINLGHLPELPGESAALVKFGYDVGHNKYDPALRRIFVTIQQLTDQGVANPAVPPAGTGELVGIDPVRQRVLPQDRLQLPTSCGTPHGLNIDQQSQIAYIACTDLDPDQHLVPNLVRVDLRTMKVIPGPLLSLGVKPDIVVVDQSAHTVFVGSNGSVSIFSIQGRSITSRGAFIVGKGTHTLVVDEKTQFVYFPLPDGGGRPVLRIEKFNPSAFS